MQGIHAHFQFHYFSLQFLDPDTSSRRAVSPFGRVIVAFSENRMHSTSLLLSLFCTVRCWKSFHRCALGFRFALKFDDFLLAIGSQVPPIHLFRCAIALPLPPIPVT